MAELETAPANPVAEKQWEVDYQPTDDNGNPIGTRTHLGPFATAEELIEAQTKAHQNAVRGYFRLKNATPTPKKPGFQPKPISVDDETSAALSLLDPSKARKAIRTLVEAEYGNIDERLTKAEEREAAAERQRVAYQWMAAHPEFFNCNANGKILADYLNSNQLEWTPDNLDIAFAMTQDRMAQSPAATPPPVEAPPEPPPNPPQRRPQATPDLQPGTLNGNPRTQKPGLTKADYLRMGRDNPAEFKRHLANPKLRAEMQKALGS